MDETKTSGREKRGKKAARAGKEKAPADERSRKKYISARLAELKTERSNLVAERKLLIASIRAKTGKTKRAKPEAEV